MQEEIEEISLPEKPKKPLTMYFRYRQDESKLIKEKNPNITSEDYNKKLQEGWDSLDDTKKQNYQKAMDKEGKTYEKDLEKFVEANKDKLEQIDAIRKKYMKKIK